MTKLYEDDKVEVHLPQTAFCPGHLFVQCKGDALILEEVHTEMLKHAMFIANQMSSVLFEALQCQGTNILLQNGLDAGQADEAVIIHVIPRWEDDDLDLSWENSKSSDVELEDALSSYKFVEKNQKDEEYLAKKKQEVEGSQRGKAEKIQGEEDYYVKQLRRTL